MTPATRARLQEVVEQIRSLEGWHVDDPLSPFVGEEVIGREEVMAILAACLASLALIPQEPTP